MSDLYLDLLPVRLTDTAGAKCCFPWKNPFLDTLCVSCMFLLGKLWLQLSQDLAGDPKYI